MSPIRRRQLKDLRFGIFKIEGWDFQTPPQLILEKIPGTFASSQREKIAKILIAFSLPNREWVGVDIALLLDVIYRSVGLNERRFNRLKQVLDQMIEDGLLEIPGNFKIWGLRRLNFFIPQIVCPTNRLINTIQDGEESAQEIRFGFLELICQHDGRRN